MTGQPPQDGRPLQAEQVRLHDRNAVAAVSASALAGALLILVVGSDPGLQVRWLAGWAVALACAVVARLAVRQRQRPAADARTLLRYRATYFGHGLVWSAAAAALALVEQDSARNLLVLATAGVCASSMLSASFDPRAVLLFTAPVLSSVLVTLMALSRGATALMVVLFVALALAGMRRSHATLLESLRRRDSEQALEAQNRRLALLQERAMQGFLFTDTAGRVLQANPALCTLLGCSEPDLIARGMVGCLHAKAASDLQALLAACARDGHAAGEIEVHRPDGTIRSALVSATALVDGNAGPPGAVTVWTDITERLRSEREMRTYQVVANSITDLVSVVDEGRTYRMVNDAWCRATGLSREQAVGTPLVQVPRASAYDERVRAIDDCLALQQQRVVTSVLDLPGLQQRHIETTYYPYADGADGPRSVVLVSRDVTGEVLALQMAQKHDAEYRALLDAYPGYIARIDRNLTYTYANQRLSRLLGRDVSQIVGRTVGQVSGSEIDAQTREIFNLVVGRGQDHVVERRYDATLGRPEVDLRIHFAAGVDPLSNERALYAFGIDITERRRAEAALRHSEAELRALLDAFPGHIAAIDETQRYVYINQRQALAHGSTPEKIIGQPISRVLSPARLAVITAQADRMRAGEVMVSEITLPEGRGRPEMDLQLTQVAGPLRPDGARVYYSFGIDITARKRAEAAMRAAMEEAESANRAKSLFLAQMSHELRTPLNAILGFGQLLQADRGRRLDERQQGWVGEILRGGQHLLNLINEVLDLGRVEAGRLPVSLEPVLLSPLVDECLSLVRPLAAERGVHLPAAGACPADLVVRADRTRLKQVLLNLLANAVKYNRADGQVQLFVDGDGSDLRITVEDTGRGLSADQCSRLFQPYERLQAEGGPVEGSGIGLALSRGLMLAMGGRIGVESQPGQGSRFWIALPRAAVTAALAPPASAAPRPADEGAASRRHRVLYIEDNPVNALLMEAMLQPLSGVQLLLASHGRQGLELARTHRPSLVLTDIQMPGMDGFEVLRQLRAQDSTRDIPVLAVSANAMPGDVAAALSAGFDAYLTKPLDMAALHAALRKALQLEATPPH